MQIGMATPSIRQVVDHSRLPTGRSSARPAPINEMMTQISVRWVVNSPYCRGSGSGSSGMNVKASMPAARKTIGMDSGALRSSLGRRAAAKTARPAAAKMMLGASNTAYSSCRGPDARG